MCIRDRNLTTAFNIFVRQSLREGGIPFEVRLEQPNKETVAACLLYTSLTETDKGTLMKEVAPLISLADKDEAAKRFDNCVYGVLLCELEGLPGLGRAQKQLRSTAAMLEGKATIPRCV